MSNIEGVMERRVKDKKGFHRDMADNDSDYGSIEEGNGWWRWFTQLFGCCSSHDDYLEL